MITIFYSCCLLLDFLFIRPKSSYDFHTHNCLVHNIPISKSKTVSQRHPYKSTSLQQMNLYFHPLNSIFNFPSFQCWNNRKQFLSGCVFINPFCLINPKRNTTFYHLFHCFVFSEFPIGKTILADKGYSCYI